MNLRAYEDALARVCLAEAPAAADLAALGGAPERWLLYRRMVRNRFGDFIAAALPRTRAALGAARFEACVAAFLASAPPSTRYLREVSPAFVRYLETARPPAVAEPAWALDLARYEAARAEAAYLPADADDAAITEFELERVPALTPVHRLVRVGWDVDRPTPDAGHAPEPRALLVYREPATDRVATLALSPTAAALVEHMARGDRTTTACIERVVAAHGGAPDPAFLESVATLLADLLDRGVLLGARA